MTVSHETLSVTKVSSMLEQLYNDYPDLFINCFVPSVDDTVAEPIYPRPPFTDRMPNGKETELPDAEGI